MYLEKIKILNVNILTSKICDKQWKISKEQDIYIYNMKYSRGYRETH